MRVMIALGVGFWAQSALACTPIELGSCDVTQPVDSGLLSPFEALCPVGLHIEEFAMTRGSQWSGVPDEVWVLDPTQMSCAGAPICEGEACAPVLAQQQAEICAQGAPCWGYQMWREGLIPAP